MKNQPASVDRFVLNGTTYVVDPTSKLGSGSEGLVIAHPREPNLCVKLYHPGDPNDRNAKSTAILRSKKVQTICGANLGLPPQFTLPLHAATEPYGTQAIGFDMRRVPPGHFKLIKLLEEAFRKDYQMGLGAIVSLFADIFDDLKIIHDHKLAVGDVNLGCLLFQPGGSRAWVDTDSWSYKSFPCIATTELFAHPDLYPNLSPSGGALVQPQPKHDRFAFTVALMLLAIPGAHPFRMGKHPTVKGLQNRTREGITIFDPDVNTPAMLGSPEVLSDDVLHAIIDRLKRLTDAPLDTAMLRAFAQEVTVCGTCGTEYHVSRRQCPNCHQVTLVQATKLVSYLITELFSAKGSLLFAQVVDDNLYLVCRIGAKVQIIRVDQSGASTVLTPALPSVPGAVYRFFSDCLVVCADPTRPITAELSLYRIINNTLQPLSETSTTGVLGGESAVFDTSSRFLYRTASNALMRCELFGPGGMVLGNQIAQVHQQQSWFTVDQTPNTDREVLFGYDRALRNWEWFVIHGNVKGSHYQYERVGDLGMRTGETVEDFAVYFSASSVLLAMITTFGGRDYARYAIIGLDGVVHQNVTIDDSDETFVHWQNPHGKLHQGKSVLHATPSGIVKQQFSDGACTTLGDTTGQVTADTQLIRLFGGVGIVRRGDVLVMTGKKGNTHGNTPTK